MSAFHPTRRDLLLIVSCFLVVGLFLQFDFTRQSDHVRGRTEAWDKEGVDGKSGKNGWLDDIATGMRAGEGRIMAGMGDAKVKWGDEGPLRTEVLGHAPGEFLGVLVEI